MTSMENVEAVFPLTPIQEGMLFHSISDAVGGVFVTQICVEICGILDPDALRLAWQRVIENHAALRTAFHWEGLDAPLQLVRETVELPWQELDWTEHDTATEFEKLLVHDRSKPFDLTKAPAMRLFLIRLKEEKWRLLWSFHHMAIDGWSANIVLRNVLEALTGSDTRPASPSYAAFVDKTLESSNEQSSEFWRSRLAHRDQPTRIADPFVNSMNGHGHIRKKLSQTSSDALGRFARKNRITMNTVVLGAWARLLATYADDTEPLFGTTVTTRPHDIADIEEAVGVYINTLPITVPMNGWPLSEWLQSIQTEQQLAQAHNLSSLPDIQRQSGIPNGTPLFDSIVVFENHGAADESFEAVLNNSGLTARIVAFVDQSNYPLALLAIPGKELSFELVFDQGLFGETFAEGVLDALEHILIGFLSAEEDSATHISLVVVPSDRADPVPQPSPLHLQISAQPENLPAIRDGDVTLNYRDLNSAADRVAATLSAAGIAAGDFVGIFAPRSAGFVIGMLGIMKSGAAFVPLDPNYPHAHNQAAADDADIAAIIAGQGHEEAAANLGRKVFGTNSAISGGVPNAENPETGAYVIHTSGSQGRRKGVLVSHASIAYSTSVRETVYGGGPQRFLLLSPPAFDSAMVGLFWTLSTGGTLVLPAPGQEHDMEAIADLIAKEKITHLLCIPSLYRLLLEFAPVGSLQSLQTAIVAGEACPRELVGEHFRTLPHARLFNEYGPTEASVWCLATELDAKDIAGPVPIGTPIPGMSAYLLDRWGNPVPDSVAGELFVSGPGVAKGYLGLPEATAAAFLPDPFFPGRQMYRTGDLAMRRPDGSHIYLGRVDDQIKLNGFRIEPGEIAAALCDHPEIDAAHVMLEQTPKGHSVEDLIALLSSLKPDDANRLLDEVMTTSEHDILMGLGES